MTSKVLCLIGNKSSYLSKQLNNQSKALLRRQLELPILELRFYGNALSKYKGLTLNFPFSLSAKTPFNNIILNNDNYRLDNRGELVSASSRTMFITTYIFGIVTSPPNIRTRIIGGQWRHARIFVLNLHPFYSCGDYSTTSAVLHIIAIL